MSELEKELLSLLRRTLQAHRDLHKTYGSTAVCGGGVGGQVMTLHCLEACSNPVHGTEVGAWESVEREYFEKYHGMGLNQ